MTSINRGVPVVRQHQSRALSLSLSRLLGWLDGEGEKGTNEVVPCWGSSGVAHGERVDIWIAAAHLRAGRKKQPEDVV